MKKLYLVFMLVISVLLANEVIWAENLIVNGGFERGGSPHDASIPDFWWQWNHNNSDGSLEVSQSYEGECSAMRYLDGEGKGCLGQDIEIEAHDVLKGSVWIKTSSDFDKGDAFLTIEFKDKDYEIIQAFESPHVNRINTNWKKLEFTTGPAPSGSARACVCLYLRGSDSAKGKVYFDEVYVEKVVQ